MPHAWLKLKCAGGQTFKVSVIMGLRKLLIAN